LAGKTSNFVEIPPTRRQLEARNFETAQHVDMQKPDVSSMINALNNGTKFRGITAGGFDATYGRKLIIYTAASKLFESVLLPHIKMDNYYVSFELLTCCTPYLANRDFITFII